MKAPAFALVDDDRKKFLDWESGLPLEDYEGEFVLYASALAAVYEPPALFKTWLDEDGERHYRCLRVGEDRTWE